MVRSTHPAPSVATPPDVLRVTRLDSRRLQRVRLLAEIGNFHELRRQIGRAGGDRLCHAVAARVAAGVPHAHVALVGRGLVEIEFESFAGDALPRALRSIHDSCEPPFDQDGSICRVRLVAAGVSQDTTCDDVLLSEEAELALAQARLVDAPAASAPGAAGLAAELDRAFDQDEMLLLYQPKVHVRYQEISSAEALIRWQHPERGMIPPNDFIPIAEAAHKIDRLTLWTIRRAIDDQRRLRAAGHDLRIFINISGQLLADEAFADAACALIRAAPDACLGFEVTETSVIRDPACAIANLQRFDAIGLRISIDDYGAGLSSLAYLKQLPARELKIDKLFVTQLTSSNRDPLIVRSTIDLAHALDMEVVAEGVETEAALALLTVMGCDMVQGYLISRPIMLEALIHFLREDGHMRAAQVRRPSFGKLNGAWKRA